MLEAADFICSVCLTWLLHNWPIVLLFVGFAVLWSVDRAHNPSADPGNDDVQSQPRHPPRMRD